MNEFLFHVMIFFFSSIFFGFILMFFTAKFPVVRKTFQNQPLIFIFIMILMIMFVPGFLYLAIYKEIWWKVMIIFITWIVGFFIGLLTTARVMEGPLIVEDPYNR